MRRAGTLLIVLALTACGSQPPENPPAAKSQPPVVMVPAPAPSPTATPGQLPAPASLAGEWRIAGIDGKEFNEPYGLGLSGDASEIWWDPRCAGLGRGYKIDGNAVRFGWAASRGPEPKPGQQNLVQVCTIGPPERLADVMRALDSATTIVRTPSNGIEISGGGHSVLLFSQ